MANTLGLETLPATDQTKRVTCSNMFGASKIMYLSNNLIENQCSYIYLTSNNHEAETAYNEFIFFLRKTDGDIYYIPDSEVLPYDTEPSPSDLLSERSRIFSALAAYNKHSKPVVIITSISTFLTQITNKQFWQSHKLSLQLNKSFDVDTVTLKLSDFHYKEVHEVRSRGQYSNRGGVFDVWSYGTESAVRLKIKSSKITSIARLNTQRQISYGSETEVLCLPSIQALYNTETSMLFRNEWNNIFDGDNKHRTYRDVRKGLIPSEIDSYLPLLGDTTGLINFAPKDSMIVLNDDVIEAGIKFLKFVESRYDEVSITSDRKLLPPESLWLTKSKFMSLLKVHKVIFTESTNKSPSFSGETSLTNFERQDSVETTISMLNPWTSGVSRVIFCLNSQARREEMDLICQMLDIEQPEWIDSWNDFSNNDATCALALGNIEKGFYASENDFVFITEREVFGQPIFQANLDESETVVEVNKFHDFTSISKGDPLVHIRYGIGRFEGLRKLSITGVDKEYLVINYANDATAFVKMEDLHMVSRYSGIDQDSAPLHEMLTDKWLRGLSNSFKSIKQTAEDLISIHHEKSVHIGVSINDPDHRYEKFCTEFPFQETTDQIKSVEEIKTDLLAKHPMDRIVCGDVGFGKTEVAMRASFLTAISNLQVAILVPSTILAQQHFESFVERFKNTKINVSLLIRGTAKSQEKEILKGLADGSINIIIGTHRIIQKDAKYRRLGLMVVDEEHRFGVKQKNSLKQYRPDVNLLSMTATPIPRTLSMSMHGIRDLSVIATPPAKRLSIRTHVCDVDEVTIREAITREVTREGQIFYVHNAINTINDTAQSLRDRFPELRIEICHAQMNDIELETIMARFYRHDFDLLVCTTIIETGIDVPNANTIIIEQADHFGLAQLHQLRGRVGRSTKQAYAYLFKSSEKLSDTGELRLKVMADATSLGEGFALANHDLEIRGAGEILGQEQSGQIQAIGFQLYMRLLQIAIEKLNRFEEFSADLSELNPTDLDLYLDASIPSSYITSEAIRLSFYKRISGICTKESASTLLKEIEDRFGPAPSQMSVLVDLAILKNRADLLHIKSLHISESTAEIELNNSTLHTGSPLKKLLHLDSSAGINIDKPNKLKFSVKAEEDQFRIDYAHKLLDLISSDK